ncbi:MAG: imidazole glycerol phosphate synthase subunit HisH [Oscillospiraceae bacterium]|nr:imidazole glycerol phosphate synthase subunit HisH [Oscillospiraceae bacterium]MDY3791181.1 imidazole glycerol phosphate synthase subunit HisH [Oscillospiraceae bacterium]MDY6208842.1 imidazole glycerol phosphate synthase subunit HisH [Oscillospiraceae bacterium]
MIAIVDYGAGNIFSVKNAMDYLGLSAELTSKAEDIRNADGIILPGVGAFPWAMNMLSQSGLVDVIKEEAVKKPFLGICLGMQLIFSKGYEFEETSGLGLIDGEVKLMTPENLSIPHIGWNKLIINKECPLLSGLGDDEYVYFVHSYAAECSNNDIAAYCEYGNKVTALVNRGTVYGAQFHPEKSGKTGLKILRNFAELIG